MKKVLAAILSVLLIGSLFVGCGKQGTTDGGSGSGDYDFGGKTVTIACWVDMTPKLGNSDFDDARYYAFEYAKKKYNCDIQYVSMPEDDYFETFVAKSLSGQKFGDIVTAHCWNYVSWIKKGLLLPVTEYMEDADEHWNTITPNYKDEIWSINAFSRTTWPDYFLVYNTNVLAELNLESPQKLAKEGKWNWEKFREYCRKAVADTNNDGKEAQRTIINTASSRYDLKSRNDACQAFLERIAEPMTVLSEWNGKHIYPGFRKLANQYLLLNHPHDSICGCSLDEVHRDMHYRYSQALQMTADAAKGFLQEIKQDRNGEVSIIQVYSSDPRPMDTVLTLEIPFKRNYPYQFCEEPNNYQMKNAFRILDEQGNEIPYQLIDIRKNCIRHLYDTQFNDCDIYRVAFRAKLAAGGMTAFRVAHVPKENIATRYMKGLATSAHSAENEFLKVSFADNGTVTLVDKRNGKSYTDLLWILDDADIGDGWNYSAPVGNRSISSKGMSHIIEKVADGLALCTFRITTDMMLPKEVEQGSDYSFGPHRSKENIPVKITMDVTLKSGQPYLDVSMEVDNVAKDHRMKLMIPTAMTGDKYYSSACFAFSERTIGLDASTQDYRQQDMEEETTAGIVFKKDSEQNSGLAFVSGGGLHECAAYDDAEGTLGITLLRSFMHVHRCDTSFDGQLQGVQKYRFAIAPMTEETSLGYLQTLSDRLAAEPFYRAVLCNPEEHCEGRSFYELEGDESICFSTLKPAEDEDGSVLRLYNLSDQTACGKLRLPAQVKSVWKATLSEDAFEELTLTRTENDSCISIELEPWKIATYRIFNE